MRNMIKTRLNEFQVNEVTDNSKRLDELEEIINITYETCLPLKQISRRKYRDLPWYTKELHQIRKIKEMLYTKYKTEQTKENEKNYKDKLKEYKKRIKIQENEYYRNRLEAEDINFKKNWKTLHELTGLGKDKEQIKINKIKYKEACVFEDKDS